MADAAISVQDVSKRFTKHTEKRNSIKERLVKGRGKTDGDFWALRDVSFEVPRGSTFGLVGHNGSGKSTMLKLLAGVHRPTSGSIITDGRVSALLELGAGFHGELTGRENIYLNASILGLSRKQIESSIDKIIDFAGIGEFIDTPVKVYSSGMYVRLGFSIAVTVDPEILIVDEIIAVGDEEFQRKCFDHLYELRRKGTTICLVSHSLPLVQDLCDSAVWLDHGVMKAVGDSREVTQAYLDSVNVREAAANEQREPETLGGHVRTGSGEVQIDKVEYFDAKGASTGVVIAGEPATFRMHYTAKEPLEEVVFGLGFVHESGVTVAGPNSGSSGQRAPRISRSGHVDFHVPQLSLQPGSYRVSAAAVSRQHTYDFVDRAYELRVRGTTTEPGLSRMFGDWTYDGIATRTPGLQDVTNA